MNLHAQAELEWRACAADANYFFSRFWYIDHPRGSRLFDLRPEQQEMLELWCQADDTGWPVNDTISLKARQIGWSTLVAGYAFWRAYFTPEYKALMLSKGLRESELLLSKAIYGYRRLPKWMTDRVNRTNDNMTSMNFDNDSSIVSLPSASDPARGYTGNLLIADEFGQFPNAEEGWASMEPVTDLGGQLIVLGTANGAGSKFHSLWEQSVIGERNMVPTFYSWKAVPERDQNWYQQKAAENPPWLMAQEYPTTPEEAFIQSGNLVFDYDRLINITPRTPDVYQLRRTYTSLTEGVDAGWELDAHHNGDIHIWHPPEPGKRYTMGIDTAEGLGHGDNAVIDVISADGHQCCQYVGKAAPDLLAVYAAVIGRHYNQALAIPEWNNHGSTTTITLRNLGYNPIWRRQQPDTANRKVTRELGFKTTRNTKPMIIDELNRTLRDNEIVINSERTKHELLRYTRDDKGFMSGQPDDCVMALALANWARAYVTEPEYKIEEPIVEFSARWADNLLRQLARDRRTGDSQRIGRRNTRRTGPSTTAIDNLLP